MLLIPATTRGDDSLGWSTNVARAMQLARQENKPVLLYFTASWCGPCKQMARTTFQDADVRRALEGFAAVVLDIDAHPGMATQNGVSAVPSFLVLHPDGDELLRRSGYLDAPRFRTWLSSAADQYASTVQRKEEFQKERARLTSELRDGQPAEAVRKLFELCSRREQAESSFAVAQLKTVAQREPGALIQGLTHTNLATRIRVANVLREVLGDEFHFDPWAKLEIRQQQLTQIAKGLTTVRRPGSVRGAPQP